MHYGEKFANLRRIKKVSQGEVANGMGSQSSISRFERTGSVKIDDLCLYLQQINVHPAEFFTSPDSSEIDWLEHVSKSSLDFSKAEILARLTNSEYWTLYEIVLYIQNTEKISQDYYQLFDKNIQKGIARLPFSAGQKAKLLGQYLIGILRLIPQTHAVFYNKCVEKLNWIMERHDFDVTTQIYARLFNQIAKNKAIIASDYADELNIMKKYNHKDVKGSKKVRQVN
ncbi:MAG: helix-turn-helix domain-containing protein [Lactobacillaceae bacterium]|jgi:transcriptional regulator with XRE-family HTH domain|nr:helix-turn-helix domain-containing protein [Lactobacillaceae bacterium]